MFKSKGIKMSKAVNFGVESRRNEDQMRMVRRFIKKTKKSGIIELYKKRQRFISKSEKRKLKKLRRKRLAQEATRKYLDQFKD